MTRISFSSELNQQFKIYCAENKCSMTEKITEFINVILETPKAEKNPRAEDLKDPDISKVKKTKTTTINSV